MSFSKLLKYKCNIYRHVDSIDEDGITREIPQLLRSNVKCRLAVKSVSNTDQNGRAVITAYAVLHLGKLTDIKNGDIAEVNGKRYEVQEPYKPNGQYTSVIVRNEGEA
jgi:hypothetical protein